MVYWGVKVCLMCDTCLGLFVHRVMKCGVFVVLWVCLRGWHLFEAVGIQGDEVWYIGAVMEIVSRRCHLCVGL